MISVHRIRIWDSQSGKFKSHWTWKPQLMIGSDSKADLRLSNLQPFELRIDFETNQFDRLKQGIRSAFSTSGLIEVMPYHLHISRHPLRARHLLSVGMILVMVLGILGLNAWRTRSQRLPVCETGQLSSQRQEIKRIQSSFRQLLKEESFSTAQGELLSLKRLNLNLESLERCQIRKLITMMEDSLRRERFYSDLKTGQLTSALNLLLEGAGAEREVWERKFISSLREKYLEAYRLEEEEPLDAAEKFSEIQQLCQRLRGQSFCFRDETPSSQEKSRP